MYGVVPSHFLGCLHYFLIDDNITECYLGRKTAGMPQFRNVWLQEVTRQARYVASRINFTYALFTRLDPSVFQWCSETYRNTVDGPMESAGPR